MSIENFSSYIETDAGSALTVAASRVTAAAFETRNDNGSVQVDLGAGHLAGDFRHLITIYLHSASGVATLAYWLASNAAGDFRAADVDGAYHALYAYSSARTLALETTGGTNDTMSMSLDTPYYCVLERSGNTLSCKVYTDAARTVLIKTLSITVTATSFRYIAVMAGYNDSVGTGNDASGYSENLDLLEAAAPASVDPNVRQFIPLVEMEFDDATRLFAMDGSETPAKFYEKRVLSIGSIVRQIPRLCGLFSVGSVIITFQNSDQSFSRLRADQAWRGRTVRTLQGDPNDGASSFSETFTGVISDWIAANDEFQVEVSDDSLDRFKAPATKYLKRLVSGGYPNATPNYMQGYLIPWVGGRVQPSSSGDNAGQLPAFCIDPVNFIYVAAHEAVTVSSVYVYGKLKTITTDYTLDTFTATGGEVFTIITFAADPRDFTVHTTDETEVTWSGDGVLAGGMAYESRPIYLFEYFLKTRAGFAADGSEFDAVSWDRVKTEFDDRGYSGTLIVTKADFALSDIIGRFLKSWGLRMFRKRNGLWALDFIGLTKTPALTVSEGRGIIKGTFKQRGYSSADFASRLQVNYDYNYASPGNEYFGHTPDIVSEAEKVNLKNDIPDNLSLWFARSLDGDPSVPYSLGALYLSLRRENGNQAELETDIENFDSIDLGDICAVTHIEGIGDSGFVSTRIVILETRLTPSPKTAQLILSGYVEPVLPDTSPGLSATFSIGGGLTVEDIEAA
jgi:hypothetical protein